MTYVRPAYQFYPFPKPQPDELVLSCDGEMQRDDERTKQWIALRDYEAPSNIKDPVKIKAAIEKKKEDDYNKAVFRYFTSICRCWSVHNPATEEASSFYGPDETDLVYRFLSYLEKLDRPIILIGKNFVDFDFPFLIGRALALGIGLPDCFKDGRIRLFDIDWIWSRSKFCSQTGKLADYAFAFNLAPKLAHGSDVGEMVKNDEWERLADYCEHDARLVSQIWNRYHTAFTVSMNT